MWAVSLAKCRWGQTAARLRGCDVSPSSSSSSSSSSHKYCWLVACPGPCLCSLCRVDFLAWVLFTFGLGPVYFWPGSCLLLAWVLYIWPGSCLLLAWVLFTFGLGPVLEPTNEKGPVLEPTNLQGPVLEPTNEKGECTWAGPSLWRAHAVDRAKAKSRQDPSRK